MPDGLGEILTLDEVAEELSTASVTAIFEGRGRPASGAEISPQTRRDPHFKDYVLFHEYFHGDNGRGLGASHQTGWTGLVAKLLQPHIGAEYHA